MITAAGLADALTSAFLTLSQPGAPRPVLGLELVEPRDGASPDRGDLVLAVGTRSLDDVLGVLEQAQHASGLVLRQPWAADPEVQARCLATELPLLAVAADASWAATIGLLRRALDQAASAHADQNSVAPVHHDLFDMADTLRGILAAPVTIEDATSRVLAYSTGQDEVDEARMSTIVGRQVPREVRDHFRSLGVFRRLATSDAPVFVPAGQGDVKARYVVPVRAGGEWLGSIWAVTDSPPPAARSRELSAAADVVALYLLRMRAQSELYRQVRLDQIRTVLREGAAEQPPWLDAGPWRVAILSGPVGDPVAETRCQLWHALTRRRGWRSPLVADVDSTVYAVLTEEGTGVGSWSWFQELVHEEGRGAQTLAVTAGGPVGSLADLPVSRTTAEELSRLDATAVDGPVVALETAWPALVLARAVSGLGRQPLISPLTELLEDQQHGGAAVETLGAVIDHWGEPRRAAAALGVHPNTVRYRMTRLTDRWPLDLADPAVRLALRLEIACAGSQARSR